MAGSSIASTHNSSYALFSNLQNIYFWFGTEFSANPEATWVFSAGNNIQGGNVSKTNQYYALVVAPGTWDLVAQLRAQATSLQTQVTSLQAQLTATENQLGQALDSDASLQKQVSHLTAQNAVYKAAVIKFEAEYLAWMALAQQGAATIAGVSGT